MHRGYVKIWRKISDNGLLQSPNTLALFMYLLLNATHKDRQISTPSGNIIALKKGQYIAGRIQLATALKQSQQTIRTSLKRLENLKIITIKSTNKFGIYTIENYDKYQDNNEELTNNLTNKQQTSNKQATTKQALEAFKHVEIYIPPIGDVLLKAFKNMRKVKRAGEYTEIAFKATEREARKAGLTTERAIEICCERSWINFNAEWYLPKTNQKESNIQVAAKSIFKPEHTKHLMKTEKVIENDEFKRFAD